MSARVYVDLDGVLANFDGAVESVFGPSPSIDAPEWRKLQQEWPTFWADLEYEKFAPELWRTLSRYTPSILTAIPHNWPSAEVGKRIWVKKMLPKFGYSPQQQFICVLRKDKQNYATQADGTPNILIDDNPDNIDQWKARGGIGVCYIPSATMIRVVAQVCAKYA